MSPKNKIKKRSPEGMNLRDRRVILKADYFKEGFDAESEPFRCQAGFGCDIHFAGTAIYGIFESDREEARIDRNDIEFVIE